MGEKGYAVGFHMCIDPLKPTDHVHVNKGDNLTITAHVNVDSEDTRSLPIPGGERESPIGVMENDTTVSSNVSCIPFLTMASPFVLFSTKAEPAWPFVYIVRGQR